ncbi:ABC transporter substrate-binding protein [Actinacidiphila paucisporea]|uniref:Peptide/nickel transport system substrate-binding protein n=1 Tax=Actinacidiphila paucisporea TaxID=310782 RepID=A0A1M7PTA2_9ACTN|nr:ABC transporter substrate-binding protein [Actinacidiphila paucisporea]SHN20636.1 peptide/nickel transport system substrate-binding protein [Actinacidiphila paucisporea]
MPIRHRLFRSTALTSAALLMTAVAGCGSHAGTGRAGGGTSGHGGTLVIGATGKLPNPDTMMGGDGFEGKRLVAFQLYEGLTRYDLSKTDGPSRVTGALATSWTVAPDHRTWTFTLRKGVTFQDGTAFDTAAVIFNLDRYLNPKSPYYTTALGAAASEYAGDIAAYRAAGSGRVTLVTKAANGHFPEDLAHVLIASPTALRKSGTARFATHPVGTGPFAFVSQTTGQRIELAANKRYWRGAPKLDRLVIEAIPDAAARTAALRSGRVNWIEYPNPDDIDSLKSAGAQIVTNSYDHLWYWILDTAKGPWRDVRVRRAANYAIDRKAVAESLLHGTADPAYQAAPRATFAYDPKGDTYTHDPAKARQLLAEAGYPNGFSTSVTVPTGGSGNLLPVPITEALQRDLADVGIKVTIRTTDWSTLIGDEAKGTVALGSDAIAQSTTLFQSEALLPLFVGSGSPFWTGHYANKNVDRLLAAAAASPVLATRQDDYRRALAQVTADAPWLFVVNDRNPRALAPDVHGLVQPQSWFLDLTTVRVGK